MPIQAACHLVRAVHHQPDRVGEIAVFDQAPERHLGQRAGLALGQRLPQVAAIVLGVRLVRDRDLHIEQAFRRLLRLRLGAVVGGGMQGRRRQGDREREPMCFGRQKGHRLLVCFYRARVQIHVATARTG
jgi:hypothetical protein